jgi:AcrR family transcriptional regulator
MPTGVVMHDARERLFAAAERVLERGDALTSRAVTTEAGVSKGLLHRHFEDFDAFLAELVRARIARLQVREDLTGTLLELFDPLTRSILALVSARPGLLERLRETTPVGIPILTEATALLAREVGAEQALALVGGAHLLFAGREPTRPEVERLVSSVRNGP